MNTYLIVWKPGETTDLAIGSFESRLRKVCEPVRITDGIWTVRGDNPPPPVQHLGEDCQVLTVRIDPASLLLDGIAVDT